MDSAFRTIDAGSMAHCIHSDIYEDFGKNSSLWEQSAATASLLLERGRKWRDTFPQFRKSKNMPDILLNGVQKLWINFLEICIKIVVPLKGKKGIGRELIIVCFYFLQRTSYV